MKTAKTSVIVIAALVLLIAFIIGGYQLSWWVTEDSVNRTAEINQDSFSRQNALVEQILDDIREVQGPSVPDNQRIAITAQICDSAAKLTGSIQLPPSANTFIAQEC